MLLVDAKPLSLSRHHIPCRIKRGAAFVAHPNALLMQLSPTPQLYIVIPIELVSIIPYTVTQRSQPGWTDHYSTNIGLEVKIQPVDPAHKNKMLWLTGFRASLRWNCSWKKTTNQHLVVLRQMWSKTWPNWFGMVKRKHSKSEVGNF